MALLSTHVLDTSRGAPAEGVNIELYFCEGPERQLLTSAVTNSDGRTTEPLLAGDTLRAGVYELCFQAAGYFRRLDFGLRDPPFLDEITIRFGISDVYGNYHVPLLMSPYGYTAYRGS